MGYIDQQLREEITLLLFEGNFKIDLLLIFECPWNYQKHLMSKYPNNVTLSPHFILFNANINEWEHSNIADNKNSNLLMTGTMERQIGHYYSDSCHVTARVVKMSLFGVPYNLLCDLTNTDAANFGNCPIRKYWYHSILSYNIMLTYWPFQLYLTFTCSHDRNIILFHKELFNLKFDKST